MQHIVNRARDRNVVTDIDLDQTKTLVTLKVGNVLGGAGHEVIEAYDIDVMCLTAVPQGESRQTPRPRLTPPVAA